MKNVFGMGLLLAILIATIAVVSCSGDSDGDDDDGPTNCSLGCLQNLNSAFLSCTAEEGSCLTACPTGDSYYSCSGDCTGTLAMCGVNAADDGVDCSGQCDGCLEKSFECLAQCGNTYGDCANVCGNDWGCQFTCRQTLGNCNVGCSNQSVDCGSWFPGDCVATCSQTAAECAVDCVGSGSQPNWDRCLNDCGLGYFQCNDGCLG